MKDNKPETFEKGLTIESKMPKIKADCCNAIFWNAINELHYGTMHARIRIRIRKRKCT